jgi:hypothetical protein
MTTSTPTRWARFVLGILVTAALARGVAFAQELPAPGPEHARLKQLEGEWIATLKSPGGDSKGTMTYRMECGGLWLVSDFHADLGGQKFQGRGLDGYDAQKKKYVSVWVDSMSPRPLIFEGDVDADKKELTMRGEGPGPDGKPVKFKSVSRRVDADHETFKMFIVGADGTETEMMTIQYERKK